MYNSDKIKIIEYIRDLAMINRIESFYPQTASRVLNIPLEIITLELKNIADKEGIIELNYEIRCLNDLNTVDTVDDYSSLLGTEIDCDLCDSFKVTYSNIFPIYFISKEYKNELKKK